MESGVCALCGADVRIDDGEGRVVCEGCDMATDNCTCICDDLETRHSSTGRTKSMRKGTSASWIADVPEEPLAEEPADQPGD